MSLGLVRTIEVQNPIQNAKSLRKELKDLTNQIKTLQTRRKHIKMKLKELDIDKKPWVKTYYEKPIYLYVLALEGGYWYIGMSRNVEKRFKLHLRGKGAAWTKVHKPIRIVETRPTKLNNDSEASILEDQLTIEYARKYGTEIVRGGGYCQTKPRWPALAYEPDLSWIR